jgi:hypothetical protein
MRTRFSRPLSVERVRRGALEVNRTRVGRPGSRARPGLEIVLEIYSALVHQKHWMRITDRRTKRILRDDFQPKLRLEPMRPPRSLWEAYRLLHADLQPGESARWLALLRRTVLSRRGMPRRCPGLCRLAARDASLEGRLVEVLRRTARTRGGGRRPAFEWPETLATALAAAALKKHPKSISRRVDFSRAPVEVFLGAGLGRHRFRSSDVRPRPK